MSDPLGLSVGTTNLVAARVGNQPVTRRSMLTLGQSGGTITGFVERVGDRVPLVTPDGKSYLAEQLLVEALDAMVELGGGPSSDVAIAVPAHWNATTIWAFRGALANSTAVTRPVIPAPTTATSASRSVSSIGLGGDGRFARLASHNDVMKLALPGKRATKRNSSKARWRNTVQTACSRRV